ncbi:four helix bundle protein [Hymenobacter sp.]|uniref:four helix bundle protein n=1 Tax=Hymenobacter sp. TaxID=1898978 RepID=UPI00286CDB1D|nr:four helix bundle protein [Hymenobacter sp.]
METSKHEAGPLLQKSFAFAVRMMKFYRHLQTSEREFIVSKQLVRSATSIGANAEEATGAISSADFSSKISIAYKEARETSYWLRVLHAAGYIENKLFSSLHDDCQQLCRILYSILRSSGRA